MPARFRSATPCSLQSSNRAWQVRPGSCNVPKFGTWPLTWCFIAELGGSPVLVDHSAEDSVASDRGVERDHGGRVVRGGGVGRSERTESPAPANWVEVG
jgi:hypothetical protein